MKYVVVTGAAGFLGCHIVKRLLSLGHHVIGIDDLTGGDLDLNVSPLLRTYQKTYSFWKLDASSNRLDLFLEEFEVDAIFHAACYPHEGLSVSSPKLVAAYSVGLLSMNVLRFACKKRIRRLINFSSMARYGKQDKNLFTEDMRVNPVDPYGTFKYASELAMKQVCDVNGVEFVNLVPHNIYGPHQKYDDPFRNVAAIMCNRVLRGLQPIIYGDGTQKRCFSYVEDIIDPILVSLYSNEVLGKTINIGPQEPFIEIKELARMICEIGGLKYNPIFVPSRPCEVKEANCSNKLSRQLLGASYTTPLESGLFQLYSWIRSNGHRDFKYHLDLEIINKNTPITWIDRSMNV